MVVCGGVIMNWLDADPFFAVDQPADTTPGGVIHFWVLGKAHQGLGPLAVSALSWGP